MLSSPSEFRLFLPETIWLEPDHFEQARAMSHSSSSEALQWQTYVNALAFLGFSQWLDEKMPESRLGQSSVAHAHFLEGGCLLKVGEFKLCLIAVEHVLDEVIPIPQEAIFNPERAAHFYVALEVCQEEEQVIIRGIMRHDQLTPYLRQIDRLPTPEGCHSIPLSRFDPEPNHLLSYGRYLEATAIPLPEPSTENATTPSASRADFRESLYQTKTNLSAWLQDRVEEGWRAIDTLIHPEAFLALNTRNSESGIRKGKLLNLGLKLGQQSAALLVTINPEPEEKLNVLVQLHPTDGQRFLPPQIKLTLQSKEGEILQEVQARGQDNYVQLQSFKGSFGNRFSLEVSLSGRFVKEEFEL